MNNKFSKYFASKRRPKDQYSNDSFMIKHFQRNKHNDISMDIASFDERRVVFISLFGLFRTWRQCPSVVLYSALFILQLKREWIYFPKKYHDEIQSNVACKMTLFSNCEETDEFEEFIALLKWKDDQGLMVWTLNEYTHPDQDPVDKLINPFWYHLNEKLTSLYDVVLRNKYKPLILDTKFWRNKALWKSKYNLKKSAMLDELYFCNFKYKSVQEVLYQSYPQSLIAVRSFSNNIFEKMKPNLLLYDDIDGSKDSWVFTDYYDPYDL